MFKEYTKDDITQYLQNHDTPTCHSLYLASRPRNPKIKVYVMNFDVSDYDTMQASYNLRSPVLLWDRITGFTNLAKLIFERI
jgi:hypothetical protein